MPVAGTSGTNKDHRNQMLQVAGLEFTQGAVGQAVAGAVTLNQPSGRVLSESITTAAGSTYTLTLTDSVIDATGAAQVFASAALNTSTTGLPQVVSVTPGNGQVVIIVKNIHASAAFNGKIQIDFFIARVGAKLL